MMILKLPQPLHAGDVAKFKVTLHEVFICHLLDRSCLLPHVLHSNLYLFGIDLIPIQIPAVRNTLVGERHRLDHLGHTALCVLDKKDASPCKQHEKTRGEYLHRAAPMTASLLAMPSS